MYNAPSEEQFTFLTLSPDFKVFPLPFNAAKLF